MKKDITQLLEGDIDLLPLYVRKMKVFNISKSNDKRKEISIKTHNTNLYNPHPFYKLIIKPFNKK